MNAAVRLALFGSAVYLGVQFARWEPGLAFPLGVIAALSAGLWILRAYQRAFIDERNREAHR